MKIKQIYNPKKVYDGWFESYFIKPWIRHYADFVHGESAGDCLRSLLAWLVMTLGLAGLLMGLVGLMGPEVGFACLKWLGIAWLAASAIPFIALLARTFNGAEAQSQVLRHRLADRAQCAAVLHIRRVADVHHPSFRNASRPCRYA